MSDASLFSIEPFFLPLGSEYIFCNFITPITRNPKACVLYLHPFAEEMHKSRRMAALQARKFASQGYAVLQIDLLGCGDSTADFEDASWDIWKECAKIAVCWLKNKMDLPIILWGLRLGGLLAVEVSRQLPRISGLILWQPTTNGENFINQFLRIRIASEMLAPNQLNIGIKQLREKLNSGESVEVGGYSLSSKMALAIDKLRIMDTMITCEVFWFELSNINATTISPASIKVIDYWKSLGTKVHEYSIKGDYFWLSQEIQECHDLLDQTQKAILKLVP